MKSSSPMNGVEVPKEEGPIWDQFRDDIEMLERLRVTPQELAALKNCVLLGTLTCKQDMLFILRQIRIATGRDSEDSDDSSDEMTYTPAPIPRRVNSPAKNFSARANCRANVFDRGARESGSPAALTRSPVFEQFALAGGALILMSLLMWSAVTSSPSGPHHFLTTTGIEAHKPVAPNGASQSEESRLIH